MNKKCMLVLIAMMFIQKNIAQQINNLNNSKDQGVEVIKIPNLDNFKNERITLSEIQESSFVIKLETSAECLIGRIDKLIVHNDRIFILDAFQSKALYEFTMKGSFVRKYGSQGKGPGEYISPHSFSIDKKNNELLIYDRSRLGLLVYDFTGNYKRSVRVNIYANDFAVKDSGDYIFDTYLEKQRGWREKNTKEFSLRHVNRTGSVKKNYLETHKAQLNLFYRSTHNLVNNSSGILFNAVFDNIIYKVQNNNVTPLFQFEFEDKTIPDKMDHNISFKEFSSKIKSNRYVHFFNAAGYFLVNDVLLFDLDRGDIKTTGMYSLKTKKIKLFSSIDNDTDSFGFLGSEIGAYKDFIVRYAEPIWFIQDKYYKNTKYTNTRVQEIMDSTTESDNPILIFNKIKNF